MHSYDDTAITGQPVKLGSGHISDAAYLEIVRGTVIACVDTVFYNGQEQVIYLAKRAVYPMKGPWVTGGRLTPGDQTPVDGMLRKLLLETGFQFQSSQLRYLATNYYRWDRIAQGDTGGASLAVTFAAQITRDQAQEIGLQLERKEYEHGFGLQPYTRERLVAEQCHPALLDLYDLLFPKV